MKGLHLITAKPVMYIANVDENGFDDNPHLDAVLDHAKQEGAEVVAICAAIEAEIAQLDEADKAEFLADLGFEEAGLNRVIRSGYAVAGAPDFLHRRAEGSARMDDQGGRYRAAGGGRDPHGLREGLHPGGGDRVRRLCRRQGRAGREGSRDACGWRARSTSSGKATSCTSASTFDACQGGALTGPEADRTICAPRGAFRPAAGFGDVAQLVRAADS